MPGANSILRDLKALGSSAPLRAVYEGSKRSGFHSVLFREVRDHGLVSRPVGLGGVIATSAIARERCLSDAAAILARGVRVFGHRVPTGVHAAWNVDPLSGAAWPENASWWSIDIRTHDRLSDVKWVWEAARHRDLVVLARAAVLEPDESWLTELEAMLRAWLTQCRPERGVNWYSSLELALRAIAWAQVIELVGDRLDMHIRRGLDVQLVASARHIMLELPYTVSSMKNNHLLGDGLGLVVLGRMFPAHPGARRWQRIGDALLLKQLRRHMHPDGSMIEDSLSYHRFVLEMLIVRVLLGGAPTEVHDALESAAHYLRDLGALDGEVPQFGDWDEGRILADSQPAGSVAGSAWLGLALAGYQTPDSASDKFDEIAWYYPPDSSSYKTLMPLRTSRRAGNFHIATAGDLDVWVKTGTSQSHQHADIGSVWIKLSGGWLTRDPGTGTYNGPLDVRNGFRSSAAHPVWRPKGADQLVPHRAFRWLRQVTAISAERAVDGAHLILSVHDAFVNEPENARVARLVDIRPGEVRVVDFLESTGARPWLMTVPFGRTSGKELIGVDSHIDTGQATPFRGWHSDTYGRWEPAPWAEVRMDGATHVWGYGFTEASTERSCAHIGDSTYRITWSAGGVTVGVEGRVAATLGVKNV